MAETLTKFCNNSVPAGKLWQANFEMSIYHL